MLQQQDVALTTSALLSQEMAALVLLIPGLSAYIFVLGRCLRSHGKPRM